MSRLPQPGERARILPSSVMDRIGATGRTGEVLEDDGFCIAVQLDDATGIEPRPGTATVGGVVFCTILELELAEGVAK